MARRRLAIVKEIQAVPKGATENQRANQRRHWGS
jgi:hypothetical protein